LVFRSPGVHLELGMPFNWMFYDELKLIAPVCTLVWARNDVEATVRLKWKALLCFPSGSVGIRLLNRKRTWRGTSTSSPVFEH
jgi:hypothetical protein